MTVYVYIVIALALFVGGGATGVKWEKGVEARRELAAQEHAREVRNQRERAIDEAATAHEADKREIEVRYKVITNEVNHVVQSEFYRGDAACFDDAGLRQLRAAAGRAEPASQPASAVRGPDRAR